MKITFILLAVILALQTNSLAEKGLSIPGPRTTIEVYVDYGEVSKHYVDYKKGITLADIIDSIGGFQKYTDTRHIWVIPQLGNSKSAFIVDASDGDKWKKRKIKAGYKIFIFKKRIVF